MAILSPCILAKRTAAATSFSDVTRTIASGERPEGTYLFQISDCRVLSNARSPRAITLPSMASCRDDHGGGAVAARACRTCVIRLTAPAPIIRRVSRRDRSISTRLMLTLLGPVGARLRRGHGIIVPRSRYQVVDLTGHAVTLSARHQFDLHRGVLDAESVA